MYRYRIHPGCPKPHEYGNDSDRQRHRDGDTHRRHRYRDRGGDYAARHFKPDADRVVNAPPDLADGWLLFSRFDESTHSFVSAHLIRPDGTGETAITLPLGEPGARWSHDGTHIATAALLDDGRVTAAIIRPDGTVEQTFDIPDPTLNLVCRIWSPDDQRLACDGFDDADPSQAGAYTVRASDGGDLVRLTTATPGTNEVVGDYSPDGQQIVFRRTPGEAPAPLMLVDADGTDPRALTDSPYEDSGRFSPDGETILTSANGQLVFLDLEGSVLSTIREQGAYLFGPVWSPDGEWIAYSRTVTGFIADLFISRPDGSDRWQVTHTGSNEITVDWGAAPSE